jgi:glycerol uptake facilitator-like aquaporin
MQFLFYIILQNVGNMAAALLVYLRLKAITDGSLKQEYEMLYHDITNTL